MYLDICLADGTPLRSPYLDILNPALEFSAQRRRDVAIAWKHCKSAKGIAVVIVKNGRVLGQVEDEVDWAVACKRATSQFRCYYGRKKWILPDSGVVAVVRPFPRAGFITLRRAGVDTLFALERLHAMESAYEQDIIDDWVGRKRHDVTLQDRRIFITYPFKAKAWQ